MPQEIFSNQEQKIAIEEVSVTQRELVLEDTTSAAPSDDSWKVEYEAQVQSWRTQSAEAREKAEKERLRWESIRAIEREETAKREALGIPDEPAPSIKRPPVEENWQSVGVHTSSSGLAAGTSQSAHLELESDLVSLYIISPMSRAMLNNSTSMCLPAFALIYPPQTSYRIVP